MKQLDQQDVSFSVSHGATLPNSVLATTSLSTIINRAATRDTGITFCGRGKPGHTRDFLSYGELLKAAQSILRSLRNLGLKPQDRVILQLKNPHYFFASLWGCWLGGFVPIPLGVEFNLTSPRNSKLYQAWVLSDSPLVISDVDQDRQITVAQVGDLLANEPDDDYHCGSLSDLALLLFTSGSTGKPKGVMLSARNLIASIYGMAKVNQLTEQDISLNWMPIEHVASLVMFHLTQVYLGSEQIQVQSELILQNPLQWLDLIDEYRVTATWSPNFAYNLVNEKLRNSILQDWDLSCLRWMGNGAEAVVGQTTRSFLELLQPYGLSPTVVSPGYGMSETSSGIAHSNNFYRNMNRDFVSVGAPIPGVSLRIVNQTQEVVPEGEIGLLQVRGETVTAGYFQQPELNQETFTEDGWFVTGDLGFLRDGQLTITGRQKDVIIINGVNFYNHDLETVVEAISGVAVSYTAACGVKDRRQQEQVAIFFSTGEEERDNLRKLVNRIRQRVFEQIGVAPAYIIPVEKEVIPKTAIGKIKRSQLAERFATGEFDGIVETIEELFNQRDLSQQDLPDNAIESQLLEVWREVLDREIVSIKDNFFELGGNSLLLMEMLSLLTPLFDGLSAVTLFQYPTISALASYLNSDRESDAVQQGKRRGELRRQATGNKDVAIIGMSCRFPGANSIEQFWHNLTHGVESISWFDDQEVLDAGVTKELLDHPDYVKASPILSNVTSFDADFWGYSPKEAQLLDPQQRLFLECAWEGLEDAGYDPFNYSGDISLFGGAATNTYLLNNVYPNRHSIDRQDEMQVVNLSSMGGFQVTTANDKDYLTTRTSYKLQLTGSSVNVQTACSTSLVAVHLACQSLINSESDMALAGGVSVHSPQKMGYLYQEGMILSPDGHCRAFAADAAGTIFGSGAGIVVLKLLDRAIADGDRIYGVIKASAVNNDGGTKVGYLAPNIDGQTRVVAEALAVADIAPESVGYIEAHGTGTKLGDPIEMTALSQAYHYDIRKGAVCAVGSVKTNLGHLQMASGIVGLIKTTLCIYHRQLVPSLHFSQPNPKIDFTSSPFYVNTELQDWKKGLDPRRAGVNSLGIGGTNAHLILEEFVKGNKENIDIIPAYLLTLSAKTESALTDLVSSYQDYLIEHTDLRLADICMTSNIGRHHFDYRVGIVARDLAELGSKLSAVEICRPVAEVHQVAFLFTGQGSQYVGMGQQLYHTQAVFREYCDRCWSILDLDYSFLEVIFNADLIEQTLYTQPLLFTIEYSLAQLWLSWGVKPDVVIGHSIGEYVAACIAEVFGLTDALKLVFARGKLMQDLPKNGAMVAVFGNKKTIDSLLDNRNLYLAADNGSHFVLSGLRDEIICLVNKLDELEIKSKLLNVSHGFHSDLMQPMIKEFELVAETIGYNLPTIPIVSNITGQLANETIATAEYWSDHILQPVQFASSVKYLEQQRVNIFLEIGTKPILTGMVKSILNDKLFLSSLDDQQNDWRQILDSLSQLYRVGLDINWSEVTQVYQGRKLSLPHYPFQRQRYWYDLPQRDSISLSKNKFNSSTNKLVHPLLGNVLASPLKQIIFQSNLQPDTLTWLKEHCLQDKSVFPGTAYLEIAIASGLFKFKTNLLTLEDITINSPLYLNKSQIPEIQLILDPQPNKATWEIYSLNNQQWQLHCSGKVSLNKDTATSLTLETIKTQFNHAKLDVQQHYLQCQQRGINYGSSFQGIKKLWAKENQALGLIEIPDKLNTAPYNFHPAILDSCLQILFAALPTELATATYIPVAIDTLEIYSQTKNKIWSYLQLKPDHHHNLLADVYLYSEDGELIAKLTDLKSQSINTQPDWHNWLYQPQWLKQPLPIKSSLPKKTGTWLIFADKTDLSQQLVTLLETQSALCRLVTQDTLKDTPAAFNKIIQQQQNLTGVIYLWSLDSTTEWQECKTYLYLVQALIRHGNNPPLWFITRNAQPVNNYQLTSGINNSCLWGMQKAIALEHPELSWVGIDLDRNFSDNEAATIFQEMCATENEQVAYRNQQRYVSRLVRWDMSTCSQVDQIDNNLTNSKNNSVKNSQRVNIASSDMSTCSQVDQIDNNVINSKNNSAENSQRANIAPSDMSTCSQVDQIDNNVINSKNNSAENSQRANIAPSDMSTCSQVDQIDNNVINSKNNSAENSQRANIAPSDMSTCSQVNKIDNNLTNSKNNSVENSQRANIASSDMSTCNEIDKIDNNLTNSKNNSAENSQRANIAPSDMSTCSQVDQIDNIVINSKNNSAENSQRANIAPSDMSTCSQVDQIDNNVINSKNNSAENSQRANIAPSDMSTCSQVDQIDNNVINSKNNSAENSQRANIAPSDMSTCSQVNKIDNNLINSKNNSVENSQRANIASSDMSTCNEIDKIDNNLTNSKNNSAENSQRANIAPSDMSTCSQVDQIDNIVINSQNNSVKNSRLYINDAGSLDSLEWKTVTRKPPQDNEIEIEVKATGLNFRDVMVALDLYPDDTKFLGLECAGIITKLGKDVTNFQPGDQVIAISDNSFSQYLTVNSLLAIKKPATLNYNQAATIPVTFLTAYYTLVDIAQLQPKEKILIHAAAGGVGLAAIQIAQQLDAEIYATASRTKWQLLKSLGVTNIMNSRSLHFAEEIISATKGKGVDVILNSLSDQFIPKSLSVLKDQGRFIEIGKQDIWTSSQVAQVKPNVTYSIIDLWQITKENPELIQKTLYKLRSQFTDKKLKPLPHKTFTRDQTIKAFRYMQQGKHQGKIIITSSSYDPDSTYLITGGMGAIGLEVAEWLITKGITNLVLIGRSEVKPELQTKLQKIQDNAQLNLIKADIANTDQLTQALSQIETTLPPLRGVIHCAGLLCDRTILQQDWSSFSQVLAPKVQGAWNLHQLTQKYSLDHFILFSSASSLLGSPGQANYCAANAFLDTLAHGRRNSGLPAISINWGAWHNTGLAANSQITTGLKQQGINSLEPGDAIAILEQILIHNPPQIGVIPINWNVWQQNNNITNFYKNIVVPEKNKATKIHPKQQLLTANTTQRRDILIQQISEQVANILGIKDLNKIDLDLGFSELGLDSLASVELRNKLQSNYELKLSTTVIFDYSNIRELANHLLNLMFKNELNKKVNTVKQDDSLTQIKHLSEAEAEALLLAEFKSINL